MAAQSQHPIVIPGSGLAGSLMAIYLAQRGFRVELYERRPDMRQVNISAGKSINLALSVRGLHALHEVGLGDEVTQMMIPMRGRMIHRLDNSTEFQPYSHDQQKAINSISRGGLNKVLMNKAESLGVKIIFNQRSLGMNFQTGEVRFRDEGSGREYAVPSQTVIGADGAFSGVRDELLKQPLINYSQQYHPAGYKELHIPPGVGGAWQLEKNALHIWPRGSFMMIALPNEDGSFTVTLFFPHKGENSFESLDSREKVMAFFQKWFPDALPLMPDIDKLFFENPTGMLVTVRVRPWSLGDKLTLVGDACHAVVPFYGQGMNCAFEDCAQLNECVGRHGDNWATVFEEYQQLRMDNANAIADMAIENYIEMRDKVADPMWQKRKHAEHRLEDLFPGKYVSRYEMISFTRTPYAEAQRLGVVNERILDELVPAQGEPDFSNAAEVLKKHLG